MLVRGIHVWPTTDEVKYVNSYKPKVHNREPVIAWRGMNATPPQDMYFKGALFINTLRGDCE